MLAGTGLSWQDSETYDLRAGDCIVHRVGEEAHTMIGREGLDVLAFGEGTNPTLTWLPRPRMVRMGISFHVPAGKHPWELEAELGAPRPPALRGRRGITLVAAEGGATLRSCPRLCL